MSHATLPLWANANADERIAKLREQVDDLYRITHGAALQRIVATLQAHHCADEKESRDVQFIIEMCHAHPNILSATCEVGHITGSAIVMDTNRERVLLNHHKKFDRWMQFGGHGEAESEPHLIALREGIEESGLDDLRLFPNAIHPLLLDVDVHPIPQKPPRPQHYHLDMRYLLLTDAPQLARATDESNDIRWFALTELDALNLEPNVQRMIAKARSVVR